MGELCDELVWDICERDRQLHLDQPCEHCPAKHETDHGPVVRGCYHYARGTLATLLRRLRVPSEGMVEATGRLDLDPGSNVLHTYPKSVRRAVLTAMIDHLIAEGERRG